MENRRLHGCLGVVVGLALAALTAMLLGRGLSACDGGVNNAANSTFLLFLFIPGLWAVLVTGWVAVGALLGSRPLPHAVALAVTLLVIAWCALSLFWSGPTYGCPSGVPPWWPPLLPTPGF
ncbi:hypothetical protein [Streptomyces sp. SID4985]|uniref:hypothetical protein n=1 Tax=unclassified Streptomyces TaxID=2593676 RepID=UPI0013680B94|nr:hypothetical protein [Streptomyces sp. SID4985]MYQ47227.1 hypothetical protein [Streptomyces sp. SID4985]